ncbi:MAG: 50S ribosomal protein L25 [Candidatus Krumholzibacteria bacterium]|nr:50S ribosomal protein L25 [Candidatus Krumholzibacteria bacterium]
MENLKLETEIRTDSGKGTAHKLRAVGRIPGVLYGRKEEAVSLVIKETAIRAILHSHPESAVIDLDVKGGKSKGSVNVIIRDIQRHPATGKLLHIDFQRISLDEKVRVQVRIILDGDPRGVKEQGGILEHVTRALNIMCLPTAMPESIHIDVAELMIGDAVKLKDIVGGYPDIDFLDETEITLANLIPPIVEAKPEEGAEVEEEEGEPELVSKEKEGEEASAEKPKEEKSS